MKTTMVKNYVMEIGTIVLRGGPLLRARLGDHLHASLESNRRHHKTSHILNPYHSTHCRRFAIEVANVPPWTHLTAEKKK